MANPLQRAIRTLQGKLPRLCQHCGVKLSGLAPTVCLRCGQPSTRQRRQPEGK